MAEVLISLFGGAFLAVIGYIGVRLIDSVDRLNEKVGKVIAMIAGHEERIKALEEKR